MKKAALAVAAAATIGLTALVAPSRLTRGGVAGGPVSRAD